MINKFDTWAADFSSSLRWHPPAEKFYFQLPTATWFVLSSSLNKLTGLLLKIVSLYPKYLSSPSDEGIMINGPSVGFHLKNRADTSSLKYMDSLNCSFDCIMSFLSISFRTGGYKNWLVCWRSLCKFPIFLSFLDAFYNGFYSQPVYLQIVIPIFHPLNFLVPVFLRIIFSIVGWVSERKYWGFLHQLGLSLIPPFFLPMPSSLV